MDYTWYLGWRDTTRKSIGSPGWWILDPSYCLENCCVGSTRIQGLGKPPRTSIFRRNLASRNQSHPARLLTLPWIRILMQVYLKIQIWISISGSNDHTSSSKGTSKSSHSPKRFKQKFIPFLEASSVSETPIPPEINNEFSTGIFRVSRPIYCQQHRSFDCTINLSSSAEPSYGRIYQLTREEDKVMQGMDCREFSKRIYSKQFLLLIGAPCFFVKQKDKLRLCMDYRGLNRQTIQRIEILSP
ncbi:hypothetical protein BASA83_013714 [Batrachochytrium salamandrivorans]|nr:hypothetical protein BASA83_013714 [Batrachochytrium salamandrivorans]